MHKILHYVSNIAQRVALGGIVLAAAPACEPAASETRGEMAVSYFCSGVFDKKEPIVITKDAPQKYQSVPALLIPVLHEMQDFTYIRQPMIL